MNAFLVSSMVVVANMTGAGMIVPQVARLHRFRGVDGVSAIWIGIGITLNLFWLGYGLDQQLWALVPVSALSLVLYLAMATLYVGIVGSTAMRRLALGLIGAAVAPGVVLLVAVSLGAARVFQIRNRLELFR